MSEKRGNAIVSPAEGPVGKGASKGAKGFAAKSSYSRPGEQPVSNRAYSGGQSAGVKGFAQDKNARKF